jgi:two-component system response regulator HydG
MMQQVFADPAIVFGYRSNMATSTHSAGAALEESDVRDDFDPRSNGDRSVLHGAALPMQRLFQRLQRVTQHQHTVMIVGERGCGKELVARAIHAQGPRAARPFLSLDCSSLAPELLERELFGSGRGSVPGAVANHPGVLEAARGGTVFLDEVASMPLELQGQLLQALRQREFQPVGCLRRIKVNARILSASSRNLEVAVRSGTFRQDLYGRLSVAILRVPPLRERKSDIPLLVNHFLEKYQDAGPLVTVSEDAMRLLQGRDWPGNVRELENCIKRALALGAGPVLKCADLAADLIAHSVSDPDVLNSSGKPPDSEIAEWLPANGVEPGDFPAFESTIPLAELEKQAILHAILVSQGDKLLAARRLGIGKTTVYRKLKQYGVRV